MFKRLSGGILSKELKIPEGTLWSHEYSGKITDANLKKYAKYYGIPFEDFDIPSREFQKKYCYSVTSHLSGKVAEFVREYCLDKDGNEKCEGCKYAFFGCMIKHLLDGGGAIGKH